MSEEADEIPEDSEEVIIEVLRELHPWRTGQIAAVFMKYAGEYRLKGSDLRRLLEHCGYLTALGIFRALEESGEIKVRGLFHEPVFDRLVLGAQEYAEIKARWTETVFSPRGEGGEGKKG